MKATLIAVTQPLIEEASSAKELISYCARLSNPVNQSNMETSDKLLSYLMKHKHWSPLEMANAVVEVEAPRDIARQLLRHRSFSFQEFSQRYADVASLGNSFCIREARLQDTKNRQNSIALGDMSDLTIEWQRRQKEILSIVESHYRWAIENGLAKEVARVILPEGLTMSRLYVNGTIRSWIHYLNVRMEEGVTQKEHVILANLIAEQITKAFPIK